MPNVEYGRILPSWFKLHFWVLVNMILISWYLIIFPEEISEIWTPINEADKQLACSCDYHQCGIKTIPHRGHAECELISAYQLLVQRRMLPLNRTSRCAAVWPPSCQTSWQSAAWRSRWRKRRHPPWEERGSKAEHSITPQLTFQ